MFRKFLAAAIIAVLLAVGIVGIASAHANEPANQCQHTFVNWEVNRTVSSEEALVACLQGHTINASTSPFAFNTSNFGFQNGFGFNPAFGFNPGFGFVPFDGFGQSITACPGGTFAQLGGTVNHPSWQCAPGLGNRFPGACPSGEQLIEFGPSLNPTWDCVV